MNWLGKWLLKLAQKANEDERNDRVYATSPKLARDDVSGDDQGLNITVRKAMGGSIVSFRHHDPKNDRYTWKTYIIPEEQHFETELGKMITLESMRL